LLIVAHSQGNFYANSAWDSIYGGKIKSDKYEMKNFPNIGLLSVATPAGHVGEWLLNPDDHEPITSYVTLINDWIINTIRILYDVLAANYINLNNDLDWKHHSFIDSYLNGDKTGDLIVQKINTKSSNLETLPFHRQNVKSSSLKSIGYLSLSNILEVEFVRNGSIYRNYDVPEEIYSNLMNAESHGSYFYVNIHSNFSYKKVASSKL
jgi:hypothetical protein